MEAAADLKAGGLGNGPPGIVQATISSLARDCDAAFAKLCQDIVASPYHDLENKATDEAGRFKIWASNIGALQNPYSSSSLDSRLKRADRMKESVVSGLIRLKDALRRVNGIALGDLPNRTKSQPISTEDIASLSLGLVSGSGDAEEAGPTTEIVELFLNIRSCITHLFTLSALLRQDRPRGRMPRQGPQHLQSDPAPYIINAKDKFPKLKQTPWLAEQIGQRTARQRDYIRYRQDHRKNLARVDAGPSVGELAERATTKATSFHEILVAPDNTIEIAQKESPEASLYSVATSFANTALGDNYSGRGIPQLTDMRLNGVRLDYNEPIECPYCRTIQVVKDRHHWKRHVYRDLQAYICTFKDCPAEPFPTSHEWFKHELDNHRRQWKCHLCQARFDSTSALETHFVSRHPGAMSAGQRKVMLKACEKALTDFDETSCLLCDDWNPPTRAESNSNRFRSHMAKHLQELACEAIPLAIEGLEIGDAENEADSVSSLSSHSSVGIDQFIGLEQIYAARPTMREGGWRCVTPSGQENRLCQSKFSDIQSLYGHFEDIHVKPGTSIDDHLFTADLYVCQTCNRRDTECACGVSAKQLVEWTFFTTKPVDVRRTHTIIEMILRKLEREDESEEEKDEAAAAVGEYENVAGIATQAVEEDVQEKNRPDTKPKSSPQNSGHPDVQLKDDPLRPVDEEELQGESTPQITAEATETKTETPTPLDENTGKGKEVEGNFLHFFDVVGRYFKFPFHLCQTWEGMTYLIGQIFLHDDEMLRMVRAAYYELVSPEGTVMRSTTWERSVKPGLQVKMVMLMPLAGEHVRRLRNDYEQTAARITENLYWGVEERQEKRTAIMDLAAAAGQAAASVDMIFGAGPEEVDFDEMVTPEEVKATERPNFVNEGVPPEMAPAQAAPHISPVGKGNPMLFTPSSLAEVEEGFEDSYGGQNDFVGNDFQLFPANNVSAKYEPQFGEIPSADLGYSQTSQGPFRALDWNNMDYSNTGLRNKPPVEHSNLQTRVIIPADARESLSEYVVYHFERAKGPNEVDDQGNPVKLTWENAVRTKVQGLFKQVVKETIRQLDAEGKTALEKKMDLTGTQQFLIERAQNYLEACNPDKRFRFTLQQISTKVEKLSEDSVEYRQYMAGRETKRVAGSGGKERKPKKVLLETTALMVYFKKELRPEVDAVAVYKEREVEALQRHQMPNQEI